MNMMLIDMTPQLGSLLTALDVILVLAATAIAASVWHRQRASLASHDTRTGSTLAVVDYSSSTPARAEEAPSDTSVPEAA